MRSVGVALSLLLAASCDVSAAEDDYRRPTQFFADATKAVTNINDGLDRAISTKSRLRDDAKFDVVRAKARNLDARLAGAIGHKEYLISSVRLYLSGPTSTGWRNARAEMDVVRDIMGKIMAELNDDQPELVELAGPSLVKSLVDRYDELVQQLRRLNETLDRYAVSFRANAVRN